MFVSTGHRLLFICNHKLCVSYQTEWESDAGREREGFSERENKTMSQVKYCVRTVTMETDKPKLRSRNVEEEERENGEKKGEKEMKEEQKY